VIKSGALIAEQPYCGLLECVVLARGVVWPLAEPIVVMTAATAVVWRGEQARRTVQFSKMMISQDLTLALAIGKLNYEVLHQPRLLTRPSALARFGFVRHARDSMRRVLGGNTIFWLTYAVLHPVAVMKMGIVKVFGLERIHCLKRLISRSLR